MVELLMILQSVSNAEIILKLFDKYGVGLVGLVFLGIFSWFLVKFILKRIESQENKIDDLIDKLTNKPTTINKEDLEEYAQNTSKIQQLIYHLLREFDADRVSIFEFHNGGKTITGVDFKKCTNTYEAVDLGIEGRYNEYQNIPISVNFLWNKLLNEETPISITDIESLKKTDKTIYSMLCSSGIKSYYSRLITDYDSKPIGFIMIKYYKYKKTLTPEQIKEFSDTSLKIAGLLTNQ